MNTSRIDNKNRRLRKKLYLGEFAIKGFEMSCKIDIQDSDEYDVFIDALLDIVETNNLLLGGGGEETFDAFVCSNQRYGSVSEEDRSNIEAWLSAHPKVSNLSVGPLVDVIYEF